MGRPDPQDILLDDLFMVAGDARRLTLTIQALNQVETTFDAANGINEALDYMANVNAHLDGAYKALSKEIALGRWDDLKHAENDE